MNAERLQAIVTEYVASQARHYQAASNNASVIGHPCARYLYYRRHPEYYAKRALDTPESMIRMMDGGIAERGIIELLIAASGGKFELVESQVEVNYPDFQVRGRIDAKIKSGDDVRILEIKLVQPYVWDHVRTSEDFLNLKSWWYHNYYHQMNFYCLAGNLERGIFALKNRLTSAVKFVDHTLDFERADEIVRKLKIVNDALKNDSPPEYLNDVDVCEQCAYFQACAPPMDYTDKGMVLDLDDEVKELLEEYRALYPASNRFKEVDEILKTKLQGVQAIWKDFVIKGRWQKRTNYEIPKEIKECYATGTSEYWVREIKWAGKE